MPQIIIVFSYHSTNQWVFFRLILQQVTSWLNTNVRVDNTKPAIGIKCATVVGWKEITSKVMQKFRHAKKIHYWYKQVRNVNFDHQYFILRRSSPSVDTLDPTSINPYYLRKMSLQKQNNGASKQLVRGYQRIFCIAQIMVSR